MPDGFQAEPPRWSPDQAGDYHRYSEVNLRKPEKQATGGWWIIIALVAGSLSVGLIAVLAFGLFLFNAPSPPVPVAAAVAVSAPPPAAVPAANAEEVRLLEGTWIATAMTANGEAAADDDLAKIKLTMGEAGFRMVLPTATKRGEWEVDLNASPKEIDFVVDDRPDMLAVYDLAGDTLRICMSQQGEPRPNDFTAKKGSGRTLLVLKRQGP